MRRVALYALKALKDLELLARKLPEDRLAQLFNEDSLASLIDAILSKGGTSPSSKYVSDERRFSLAALFATRGLGYAVDFIEDPIITAALVKPPCPKESVVLAIWQSIKRKKKRE